MKNLKKQDPQDEIKSPPKVRVKRKHTENDNKDDSTKRKSQKLNDFDIKYFRKQINIKPVQVVNLTQFIEVCKKPQSSDDYMKLYLENGGNANEILKLLDDDNKKNPTIASAVFSVLQLIFAEIQSSSPHLFQAAEETCRYFLNSYVSTIEFMLSEKSNAKQQKITLKLLGTIVGLGPELGFTVLNQLSLQPKTLIHLVKNIHPNDKDDVRIAFIQFAMAFLLDANTSLIKSALDKQGFLTLVIPGLVRDTSDTVLMVLNAFSKNVIHNVNISKTIKIRTFNQNILLSIFNLFNWNVVTKSEEDRIKVKEEVETAVFNFLLVLCTSHKHGIYFNDKFLGTSDVPTSQYLWKALESLEAPWNNEAAGRLVIKMVSNCPDLYRPVIRLVEQSYEPRHSELWFKTNLFLINTLKSLPAEHLIARMSDMTAIQITNFIRNIYLPIPILKMSLNALSTSDDAVRNQIIILLHTMLSNIKSYMYILAARKNDVLVVLKNRLEEFFLKHFPSTDILITVLHSMLDSSDLSEVTLKDKDSFQIPLPNQSRLLINVIDLLLLYNEVLPNSLDPITTMLDSKRLFDKMEAITEKDKGELKLKITMFLLCADKFAFAPDKPLFKDILQSVFEVFVSSDSSVSREARQVLYNILETTGVFEKNRLEIDLLLSVIYIVGSKFGPSIAAHIVDVVEKVHLFSDKCVSSFSCNADEDDGDGLIKHFDVIIDNLKHFKNSQNDENVIFEKSFLTNFIIGLFEHLNSTTDDSFKLLINLFSLHLFHYQDSADSMWQIVEKYSSGSSVEDYIVSWKHTPSAVNCDFVDKTSVLCKLSDALLSDTKIKVEEIFVKKPSAILNPSEILHLQTYNNLCLSERESELFSWFNLILFYVTQQGRLSTLNEYRSSNASVALNHILLLAREGDVNSTKLLRLIIGNCLTNKTILRSFSPFKKQKLASNKFLSEFLIQFVKKCNEHGIETALLDSLLRPYKHKIFLSLMTYLKKSVKEGKGQTLHNISEILSTINLDLNDATLIIIDILKMDKACMVSEENEASSWIHILCYIINLFIKQTKLMPLSVIRGVASLYSKLITELDVVINVTDFEESFYNYLIANPEIIMSVPSSTFEAIFSVKHVSKFTSKIGSLLLSVNANLLPKFCQFVVKSDVLEKRELVLPMANAAFSHNILYSNSEVIQKLYDNYKSNIMKVLEKPHKASQIYVDNSELIIKFIKLSMSRVDCENFLKKVHKFDSVDVFHINMLEAIFFKVQEDCLVDIYSNNYLLCLFHLANIALKRDIPQRVILQRLYSCLKQFILVCNFNNKSDIFSAVRENAIWTSFFKSVLKFYLQTDTKELSENELDNNENELFGIVSCLVHVIYPSEHTDIADLFEMTSSHSEFLNIMLSSRYLNVKTQLVKLLYVMVLKNKSIMKSSHITVYLSAYHGSLNMCDRYILGLLKFYERNGQSMTEYQPYLWGDIAANHYAVRSKRVKSSLWSNPTANHILNLLDKEMIEKTVKYFPVQTKLNVEEDIISGSHYLFGISKTQTNLMIHNFVEETFKKKSGKGSVNAYEKLSDTTGKLKLEEYKIVLKDLMKTEDSINIESSVNDLEIYDPAFLMPLLNFVVTPGSAVSCHRIVRGGVLALPLMGLSSDCPYMRGAAFNILQRFYTLLESEMYYRNDKVLWSQFIDTLKKSLDSAIIDPKNEQQVAGISVPRLPAVGAIYLARSALIMTHPLDPMFKPINNFVISKQYINFTVVPDLLDLFHNTDIQFLERRTWMLKILRDGVKSFSDIKVLLKSVAFKIILDFYSSNLADIKQKLLILEILNSCICIPKAAKILTDGYGLFPWLSNSFKNIHHDNKSLISMAIKLVSNIWISLACEPLSKGIDLLVLNYEENTIDSISSKCFRVSESNQSFVLCLLLDLLPKLAGTSVSDLKTYLNIFHKISKNPLNNVSKFQLLSLVKDCNSLLALEKVSATLTSAIETCKVNLLTSSLSVLKIKCNDSEDKYLIVKYLHEIVMMWIA